MDRVYKVWQTVKQAVTIRCATYGFVLSEDISTPETSGRRYIVLSRKQTSIRLFWNSEDECFLLEWAQNKDAQQTDVNWQKITHVQFHPSDTSHNENVILTNILPSVETFLLSYREEPAHPISDLEGFYRSIRCLAVELHSDGHKQEADSLGVLMSCAWTTSSELIGELLVTLKGMNGPYSEPLSRLLSDCLCFAKNHRQLLGLD